MLNVRNGEMKSPKFMMTHLPSKNIRIEVDKYAVIIYIQTSVLKGLRKEKRFGGGGAFFLYRIPTPVVMNGMAKSTAACLCVVIDKSMTAKSAFLTKELINSYERVSDSSCII